MSVVAGIPNYIPSFREPANNGTYIPVGKAFNGSVDADYLQSIRAQLIDANFDSKSSRTFFVTSDIKTDIKRPSRWQIFKLALAKTSKDNKIWKVVASLVCVVGLLVLVSLVAFGTFFLLKTSYSRISKYVTIHTKYSSTKKIVTKTDFIWGCIIVLPVSIGIVIALIAAAVIKVIDNPLVHNYKQMTNYYKSPCFVRIGSTDSSAAHVDLDHVANSKDPVKGTIDDLLTGADISQEEVRFSRIFAIGNDLVEISSAVKSMLNSRNFTGHTAGRIPHPYQHRDLTIEEQEKFLTDLSTFFSISDREKILKCWQISQASLQQNLESLCYQHYKRQWRFIEPEHQLVLQQKLAPQLLSMYQVEAFLQLIPQGSQKYFPNILSTTISIPRIWG